MRWLEVGLKKLFSFTKCSCARLTKWQGIFFLTLCVGICFAEPSISIVQSQSSIEHLLELTKNNADWIGKMLTVLSWSSALMFAAFVSVLAFIVFQLIKLAKEINRNKDLLQKIEEQKREISSLAKQVEDVRDQIQEQTLRSQKLSDEDFAKFLAEELKWTVNMGNVNFIKNFIWKKFAPGKYIEGMEKLKQILENKETIEGINKKYESAFKEPISNFTLLEWLYAVEEEKRNPDDLIYEKAESIVRLSSLVSSAVDLLGYYKKKEEAEKILAERILGRKEKQSQ